QSRLARMWLSSCAASVVTAQSSGAPRIGPHTIDSLCDCLSNGRSVLNREALVAVASEPLLRVIQHDDSDFFGRLVDHRRTISGGSRRPVFSEPPLRGRPNSDGSCFDAVAPI